MASEQKDDLTYIAGFGQQCCSEVLVGALPTEQNTPQKCSYGLIAEQLNGTAFTLPRAKNQRSWLYRVRPSAMHGPLREVSAGLIRADFGGEKIDPNQFRWNPFPMPAADKKVDFVQGMATMMGAGSAEGKNGLAIHIYTCNASMTDKALCNSDGDFLIVPQEGILHIRSEFGFMNVAPGEMCVVQRGIRFQVNVTGNVRGYICEVFTGHFVVPDLGPIGANGLADGRHFLHATASYENRENIHFTLVQKFLGKIFEADMDHSPFDVVAWHGNYMPFKYDMARFCVVNSVSFDHLDPSIFTVITCQTAEPGVAVCDFAIFPPRFMVQEHTFRPPYYHRNTMSEFMGNVRGIYDAKTTGFLPGGASLHSCMIGHGPDSSVFEEASNSAQVPAKIADSSLSFMFESTFVFKLTEFALNNNLQPTYAHDAWAGIPVHFNPNKK